VNSKIIVSSKKAGVDVFVAGSAIFDADNITAATAELKNLVK
jgi:pentose-5-phosphate-3-epimerase